MPEKCCNVPRRTLALARIGDGYLIGFHSKGASALRLLGSPHRLLRGGRQDIRSLRWHILSIHPQESFGRTPNRPRVATMDG